MTSSQQLAVWVALAIATSAVLVGVLRREHEGERARWNAISKPEAAAGERVFREKGCWECHRVGGFGNEVGPDLGGANLGQPAAFVAAFWNAAPHMWGLLESDQSRPTLAREELGHLYAFFQEMRFADPRGDADRGLSVFVSKGCADCHEAAPLQSGMATRRPLAWARAMAIHPSPPDTAAQSVMFSGDEMSDLVVYLRSGLPLEHYQPPIGLGDALRGSQILRRPACAACHLQGEEVIPGLLPGETSHASLGRLSGSLWNHAMRAAPPPLDHALSERDLSDLVAFLRGGWHVEPGGSSQLGELVFELRGCAACHGARGEGSPAGPAVRGRNGRTTTTALGAGLWRHGPEMANRLKAERKAWPTLTKDDVGNLLAFFNSPPKDRP